MIRATGGTMLSRILRIALIATAITGLWASAETDTVCILHTNDIHDHVRAGYGGLGGLPYVSGYVKSVRTARKDIMLVDAGDVMHKGDMVAARSGSKIVYEALGKIGYDAGAPGNHDIADGFAAHQERAEAAGLPVVCINAVGEGQKPYFTPSKIIDVDGVKVGIIGLTAPRAGVLSVANTAKAVAKEAARLEPMVHVIVAVCHVGSRNCSEISRNAPAVDVFVAGHQHEVLEAPKVVPETGALIICAGDNSRYVGRLELTVDLDSEEIVQYEGKLVPMKHAEIPCDAPLLQWINEYERATCPEAARVIGRCAKNVPGPGVARLCAEGMRQSANADVGLFPGKSLLAGLPRGAIDVNALFAATRIADESVVSVTIPGRALVAFAKSDAAVGKKVFWAGKGITVDYSRPAGKHVIASDVDPNASYMVALPRDTWESLLKPRLPQTSTRELTKGQSPLTVLGAAVSYVENLTHADMTVEEGLTELATPQTAGATP
jgi:5'-nucleotidase / UDP-sugar diphosphatase